MDGFLNINKPKDCTSHDVVNLARKELKLKKVGHSGTLDPMATGVLVLGLGYATKLFDYLSHEKKYIAEVKFGIQTSTDDVLGETIKQSDNIPSLEEIESKLNIFTGKILQKPPTFSAVKIGGKRSYKLARENKITLEDIKEKEVEIYSIKIIEYKKPVLMLEIFCSGGTYIRSIARDLGLSLDTYGTLQSLIRTEAGKFNIKDSVPVEHIKDKSFTIFNPLDFIDLEKILLPEDKVMDFSHGKLINIKTTREQLGNIIAIVNNENIIIGIGKAIGENIIKPEKVFIKNE